MVLRQFRSQIQFSLAITPVQKLLKQTLYHFILIPHLHNLKFSTYIHGGYQRVSCGFCLKRWPLAHYISQKYSMGFTIKWKVFGEWRQYHKFIPSRHFPVGKCKIWRRLQEVFIEDFLKTSSHLWEQSKPLTRGDVFRTIFKSSPRPVQTSSVNTSWRRPHTSVNN